MLHRLTSLNIGSAIIIVWSVLTSLIIWGPAINGPSIIGGPHTIGSTAVIGGPSY